MQYRNLGKINQKFSVLGFGTMRLPLIDPHSYKIDRDKAIKLIRQGIDAGINYIDTAYTYHSKESEIVVGMALQDGYREKVFLATKLPVWMESIAQSADFDKFLDEQLQKLQVTVIDVYMFHELNAKTFKEKVLKLGLLKKAEEAKRVGKIKYLGFSFHDKPEVLKEIIDTNAFDFMLVQYNLRDQINEEMIAYAAKKGIVVVIMGPVNGGNLASQTLPNELKPLLTPGRKNFADLALKFVWNNPNVSIALSGMSTEEMLKDNLKLASSKSYAALSPDDHVSISQISQCFKKLTENMCTTCGYCMPCPQKINIKEIFALLIEYQVFGNQQRLKWVSSEVGSIPKNFGCAECGICLEKCPQKINIPEQLMKTYSLLLEKAREN